jgi:hypothetical protein
MKNQTNIFCLAAVLVFVTGCTNEQKKSIKENQSVYIKYGDGSSTQDEDIKKIKFYQGGWIELTDSQGRSRIYSEKGIEKISVFRD